MDTIYRGEPRWPSEESLNCFACSSPIALHATGFAPHFVCAGCGMAYERKGAETLSLGRREILSPPRVRIPLGSKGRLRGESFLCIGYILRRMKVDGVRYYWSEYLLWSPAAGIRWLSEYQNHWSWIQETSRKEVRRTWKDRRFKLFQAYESEVAACQGEFPQSVRVGDKAEVRDYVDPPWIYSEEEDESGECASLGEYLDGAEIWSAFQLQGHALRPVGIAPAQPSPYEAQAGSMKALLASFLGIAILLQIIAASLQSNREIATANFTFAAQDAEKSRASEPFRIEGRRSNLEIKIRTDLHNQWAFFHVALIDLVSGKAINVGKEVEYFSGSDSDGPWSEGGPSDSLILGTIPSGEYMLWVEPESPAAKMSYSLTLVRDVPRWAFFWIVLALLVVPYLWFAYRRRNFEFQRWMESDYPMKPFFSTEEEE